MTDLLSQISPLTRGLIWLVQGELASHSSYYKDVDYLLNGLMTATINVSSINEGHVLIGENFGKNFYVLILKELDPKQIASYFELVNKELDGENEILVIDKADEFPKLEKLVPTQNKNKFRLFK